jgi:hypothetical protein
MNPICSRITIFTVSHSGHIIHLRRELPYPSFLPE